MPSAPTSRALGLRTVRGWRSWRKQPADAASSSSRQLDGVYAQIEDELRSRYLLAYQPNVAPRAGEFRPVEVRVAGAGLRVKTAGGYYP
jgi:hypothetical protein